MFQRRLRALHDLLGGPPGDLVRLQGGRNNLVFMFRARGETLVAKFYYPDEDDHRDRLGAEFRMLSFLWRCGMRRIPQPIAADPMNRIGIYRFVPGRHITISEIDASAIRQLGDILHELHDLSRGEGADSLPIAADGAMSVREFLRNLDQRIRRVRAAADGISGELGPDIKDIISRVQHSRDACAKRLAQDLSQTGWDATGALPRGGRALSTGDPGFQNVLQTSDGTLVMLDFEYAGWDDPAQIVGNICLHPAVPLAPELARIFLHQLAGVYGPSGHLIRRLRAIYPILLLRWSLVLLNEYLPPVNARRRYAMAPGDDDALEMAAQHATTADAILGGKDEALWWLQPAEDAR
jgi:hypothetical protein